MIVCKFGGSSLSDAPHLEKVQKIVHDDDERRIVVVSAPGKRSSNDEKVTDLLYRCAHLVAEGKPCRAVFDAIAARYTDILSGLGMEHDFFLPILAEVREHIEAGAGDHWAASRGEHLSARLVAAYFGWEFLETEGRIIIADDGSVDETTYEHLREALDPKKRYVVPGFYGSNSQGKVQTFSRGGSDITGAIISRAIGAQVYENWTDVSGIYRIDPRLVEGAKVVDRMTYREVRELAAVGASVFHEEAIAPVIAASIPINVKNTNAPSDEGTWIVEGRECDGHPLAGVSAKGGFCRLTVHKLMLFKRTGIRHALLTMMRVFGVRPVFSLYGIDSIVWFFEKSQASEGVLQAMCARLRSEFALDSIEVDHAHAVVGVVGAFVNEDAALVGVVSTALERAQIPITFLNYGSSATSMLIGVYEADAKAAVTTLYRALFA